MFYGEPGRAKRLRPIKNSKAGTTRRTSTRLRLENISRKHTVGEESKGHGHGRSLGSRLPVSRARGRRMDGSAIARSKQGETGSRATCYGLAPDRLTQDAGARLNQYAVVVNDGGEKTDPNTTPFECCCIRVRGRRSTFSGGGKQRGGSTERAMLTCA